MTRRQELARGRLYAAKTRKANKRAAFLVRRAAARGMTVNSLAVDTLPCQANHRQLVREVRPLAGVYLYRSSACTGCPPGRNYLDDKEAGTTTPQPREIKGCTLVENNWLVSLTPVEVGQVVTARDPAFVRHDDIVV